MGAVRMRVQIAAKNITISTSNDSSASWCNAKFLQIYSDEDEDKKTKIYIVDGMRV